MADDARASPVEIVSAEADQSLPLAAVVASAFASLPIYRWLVAAGVGGDAGRTGFLDSTIRHGIDHGEVHTTRDMSAVAVWFRNDDALPSVTAPQGELAATGEHADRLEALLAGIRESRPRGQHRSLALLAVAPDHQVQGVGSALMRHQHAYLDRLRLGAHVMAADRRSRRFCSARVTARSATGDEMVANGSMLYGGALLDDQEKMIGSVLVLDFPTRQELDAWLKIEPYVLGDVWRRIDVQPFRVGPSFTGLHH
jgi:GNAT superfamily N-acetyltransferase